MRRTARTATLKVLVVDDRQDRAHALEAALKDMPGVDVAVTLESAFDLPKQVERYRPDVILIDTESPSRDVLEQLAAVSGAAPRPVVMFTDDAKDDAIRSALKVGVSAYIVDGLKPGRLDPIIRVAMERFQAEQALRAELEETKTRLAERKAVERAKGILMKEKNCSEDEAFAALRALAMQRGIRLGEAAQQVIFVAALLG